MGNTGSSKLFYMPKRLGAKGFVPSFKGKQQLRELKTKCEWLEDEDGVLKLLFALLGLLLFGNLDEEIEE